MSLFIKKLFSREKEPKTPASGFDSNRSMIDFITDDFDPDSSFRSHQPRLDRTYSAGLDFEDNFSNRINRVHTAESLTDFPVKKPKLTITSALNHPKRGTIMEDMYEILQEQVIEQLGGLLFQTKKETALSPKLLKGVQQQDFDLYISRLRQVYVVYKKNMEARIAHKQIEQVNMAASLLKCYEIVPNEYFDDRFMFNFRFLKQDKGMIMQVQEDLSEYLDVVEINLYHQVTIKFEDYLDMMLKINSMESQIENSLYSVRFFRNFNQELRKKFSSRTQDVLRRKRTTLNIEKTLALIDLINIVKKTLPTLVHLIKKNNFESAVKIIRTSEEIYKTKLKQVKALKNYNVNFNEARNTLEKLLTTEFEDRCVNYFTPALSYNKPAPNTPKDSLVEESFLDVITEATDFKSVHPLYWSLGKFPSKNINIDRDIIKIVVEYIKIKDFPLTVYKGKLLEMMKTFHKKFMADVNELIESQNVKPNKQNANANNVQKGLPFELHLKLITFYFEVFKRFIGGHFELNHKILSTLLGYYNDNFVEKGNAASGSYPYAAAQVLDTKAMKDLNETVQEFYLTLAMIFKYFGDRMSEVINIRSFENISIQQFTQIVAVFERIMDYFHNTLQIEERLNSWIVSDKDSIKKPLLRLVSSLCDKITVSPIHTLMIEIERGFINVHHKRQLETLKTSLEQEAWQAVDIPPEYNEYFEIFFRTTPKVQAVNKNLPASDLGSTESSSPSYEGSIQEQGSNQEQDQKETFFKFEKNEFYLQGKKYQVTSSFLLLIQTLYDYFQIAFKYRFIQLDAIAKIFETIKFYNSYTIQLVLGAGATAFGKIPRITAKVLGISSISLCLLVNLIDPLYENLAKQENKIKLEWLNQEVLKVKNDLIGHINEIGAKVRSILKTKLVEQSAELRKINWASAQEKIVAPSKFTSGILTNTKQMYKQIQVFLLKEQLVAIAKGILEDMKNHYLPVFEAINVETRIAAKRVKDELQNFNDELYQVPIFQEPEVNYSDFEDRILSIIEDKCNHFLEITSIN